MLVPAKSQRSGFGACDDSTNTIHSVFWEISPLKCRGNSAAITLRLGDDRLSAGAPRPCPPAETASSQQRRTSKLGAIIAARTSAASSDRPATGIPAGIILTFVI